MECEMDGPLSEYAQGMDNPSFSQCYTSHVMICKTTLADVLHQIYSITESNYSYIIHSLPATQS